MRRWSTVAAAVVAACGVLGAAATADAQPGLTPIAPLPLPAQPAPAPPPPEPTDLFNGKSPDVALALSLAGTVIPIVVTASASDNAGVVLAGLGGMLLGPSIGHWYAGDYLTPGLGMRVGGFGVAFLGAAAAFGCGLSDDRSCGGAVAGLLIGAGLFTAGTITDVATAPSAARAWNAKHAQLVPTVISSNGRTTMGVGLGGSF